MLATLPLCLLGHPPSASAQPRLYSDIDAFVRERMQATNVPGLSYAVVGPDGPIHQQSWGVDGRGDPVTASTPFLWGSIAKPVAATAALTLVESGRIALNDPVTTYLPQFRLGGSRHASAVTIRHLLDHTSGIPSSATAKVTDCLDAACTGAAERLRLLNEVAPLGPPGTAYAYTSANYLVLTAVIEAATGRRYADYLREAVLTPAGMDGTITGAGQGRERGLAPGHQLLWGIPSAIASGVDDDGAAYGYLGGDLGDLAAFAALQLRDAHGVLSPASIRAMRQSGTTQPTGSETGYGLGWRVGGLGSALDGTVWHSGATPGYSGMLFLLPERNLALVLQQNLYGIAQDAAIMHVGFGAARLLAGQRPGDAPSATVYHLALATSTALAVALILAAGRSALLLRRPAAKPVSRLRRVTTTSAWMAAGLLPCAVVAAMAAQVGIGQMRTWLPDVSAALCVAALAGAALILLRLTLARRDRRSAPAELRVSAPAAP
ncbi:serine hydrolase domain-containing protein [Streptosporangium sp. NPDC003464]